jgi:hypothetical protein
MLHIVVLSLHWWRYNLQFSTLLDATRRYSTLLDATRRYSSSTQLDATRRYSTLLDTTRRYAKIGKIEPYTIVIMVLSTLVALYCIAWFFSHL